MGNIITAIKDRRFPKNDIFNIGKYCSFNPFNTLEPDQFDLTGIITEDSRHPPGALFPDNPDIADCSQKLNIGNIRLDLAYLKDTAPVNIAKRIIADQVAKSMDTQFRSKQFSSFGTHSFQEFHGCFQVFSCHFA